MLLRPLSSLIEFVWIKKIYFQYTVFEIKTSFEKKESQGEFFLFTFQVQSHSIE